MRERKASLPTQVVRAEIRTRPRPSDGDLSGSTPLTLGGHAAGNSSMSIRVSQLTIYPVKSLAGISSGSAEVTGTGFRHDREWMIVDAAGVFVTQRQHPSMARIGATVEGESLRLSVPGETPLDVPVIVRGTTLTVDVWDYQCDAVDQGQAAADLLSGFLQRSCRLVRMAPEFRRQVSPKYRVSDDETIGFADSMPFLLISEASLEDLNSRLREPVEMNRFRPNLVVSGATAFQEDRWKRIRIGGIPFRVAKSCVRCEIPTVDQKSGVKGIEPIETLGTYRAGPKGVLFGRHLVHEGRGTIRAGDPVEILE